MRRIKMNNLLIPVLSLLVIVMISSSANAQDNSQDIEQRLKDLNIRIPFVDRDEDGINDLLQSGWGLRFLQRYENRRAVWNQMMEENEQGGKMIDTDGDGVADTPLRQMARERMHELVDSDGDGTPDTPFREYMRGVLGGKIDTDGDGVGDTPLGQYMRKQFQVFDQDGDGVPDELTPEQIRQHFQEMNQWRQQIRDNLKNGLPAFTDEDGDGIPDNLPEGIGWMRRRGRGNR